MKLSDIFVYRRPCNDPWAKAPPWGIEVRKMLSLILEKENLIMSAETDAIAAAEAAAKQNSDAEDAVETLLTTLSSQIAALQTAQTDPATVARINALANALASRATQLSAAVVANTPAAPATP